MNHFGPFQLLETLDLRLFWRQTHVLENNSDNKTKIRQRTRDFVYHFTTVSYCHSYLLNVNSWAANLNV